VFSSPQIETWRRRLRTALKPALYRFRSKHLYRLANFYVNAVDNDHDCDFYTNGEAKFARSRLAGAKVAFDVGAARGGWTKIALAADPHVVVHDFEPTSRRFKILQELGLGERVVLNNVGLGDQIGEADIYYNASGGSNSLFPQRYNGEDYAPADVEKVRITTIDAYCREHGIDHVDFVKMDIEGHELSAIRGAEQMLRAGRVGVLQFEYSYVFLDSGTSLRAVMEYVRRINPCYRFFKLYPDEARPIDTYDQAMDNFKTQNWAMIKM
jgi:FkbM family methyltransferase